MAEEPVAHDPEEVVAPVMCESKKAAVSLVPAVHDAIGRLLLCSSVPVAFGRQFPWLSDPAPLP